MRGGQWRYLKARQGNADGIQLSQRFGYKDVILESDCQTIILRLFKPIVYFSNLGSVLEDILLLCSEFNSMT